MVMRRKRTQARTLTYADVFAGIILKLLHRRENKPIAEHPQAEPRSLNEHLSSSVFCDCPVTFLPKGQGPLACTQIHARTQAHQTREKTAELTLRSLYGSTGLLGDTVRCPDELKLAATLQDDARNFPSIALGCLYLSLHRN